MLTGSRLALTSSYAIMPFASIPYIDFIATMNKKQSFAGTAIKSQVIAYSMMLIFFALAIILLIALWSYHRSDPAWLHTDGDHIQNWLGTPGAWYSDISFSLIGKLSYLIPLAFLALGLQIFIEKKLDLEILSWRLCCFLVTAIFSGCILWAIYDPNVINSNALTGGGAVGTWLAIGLQNSIKSPGLMTIIAFAIFLISITYLFDIPWIKMAEWLGRGVWAIVVTALSAANRKKTTNVVKPSCETASTPHADEQDNIDYLNRMAIEKKTTQNTAKPSFTIGRYHSDSDFAQREHEHSSKDTEQRDKTTRLSASSSSTSSHVDFRTSPISDASTALGQLPEFDQKAETPDYSTAITDNGSVAPADTDIRTNNATTRSEPNFFDFSQSGEKNNDLYENLSSQIVTNDFAPDQQTPGITEAISASKIADPSAQHTHAQAMPGNDLASSYRDVDDSVDNSNDVIEPSPALARALSDTSANISTSETIPAAFSDTQIPEAQTDKPTQRTTTTTANTSANHVSIGKVYDSSKDLVEPNLASIHQLPSIDLLDTSPAQKDAYTEDALASMATVLEHTMKHFNVDATVMHISPGPVITRFEVDLAPGIQAKKVTGLSVDLARALSVSNVRVEEVISGSSYIGLEVPNQQRQIVYFKDVIRSKAFQNSHSPLTLSLGSDTSGRPIVADLMKMPHALVAGTTGSGKSVCINVMLLSMLYKASPKDLRLILVDPKMLEMSMYEDIPHLLTPVITDMNQAENALTWAVGEMERRYQLMAALKVRKIEFFNAAVDNAIASGMPLKDPLWEPNESVGYTHHPDLERLPFIVIVIDELADMMMVVGKQVEQLIARLTQKARAAGIHVILATQRPSTDVLTGLIKANVPTRIAFQVSSGTDSRVIIDSVGAEKLLGHGDMLYVPPGAGHPQRLHGAFVNDSETDRITNFLRQSGEPDYINGITSKQDPDTLGAYGAAEAAEAKEDADPLYEEAIEFVLSSGKASISSVQRQLRIGYNRAARMIEDMQEQGIVSEPVNGVRKVLGKTP